MAGEVLRNAVKGNRWFDIFGLTSIALIVASFIVPPTGVVDPSVLAAVGELFAFAALGAVIKAIDKGSSASVKKGDVEIKIDGDGD